MGDNTGIQWTDATWNPVVGCSVVSPGCTNCYAMGMAARIQRMHDGTHAPHLAAGGGPAPQTHYAGTTQASKAGPVWTGKVALAPKHILLAPLRWTRPRRIFVNSMGDLFHEAVPDAWIDQVFAVMALCPQHTFQVLTKRSARMRHYLNHVGSRDDLIADAAVKAARSLGRGSESLHRNVMITVRSPLPNVWLGVSAEDQRRADERVPDLLATPAAARFVSAEPLLGPINFRKVRPDMTMTVNALTGAAEHLLGFRDRAPHLDWVIVGGESGPRARPMHPDWVRDIREQCAAAGVAFFFKQHGEFREFDTGSPAVEQVMSDTDHASSVLSCAVDPSFITADGLHIRQTAELPEEGHPGARLLERVGKKVAGRLLDGVAHNGMPSIATVQPADEA